jgi:hypothetical protein
MCFLGAAYVFSTEDGGSTWSQNQKLIPSNGVSDDQFGFSVCIYSNIIVVGAPNADTVGVGLASGVVYVYRYAVNEQSNIWSEAQKLVASASSENFGTNFGYSVSVLENAIVVGVPGDDVDGVTDVGE